MAAFQQQTTGAVPPITRRTSRRASRSTTRSGTRTGRSTWACWPATTRSSARASRTASRPPSGYAVSTGPIYKMYDIPFKKMLQPRLGATWAYNGKRHHLRELRDLQSGRQFAAARRVLGPQPGRHDQRVLRRERRAVRRRAERVIDREALPAGHDAAHDAGVHARHVEADQPRSDGASVRPVPVFEPLLGRHQQQRPADLRHAGGMGPGRSSTSRISPSSASASVAARRAT